MAERPPHHDAAPWRRRTYEIIFGADTPAGKAFDVILIGAILMSIAVVLLDSVQSISASRESLFVVTEWIFTALFTVEYILRLLSVRKPTTYAFSFFGVIDLFSILPSYLSLILPGGQYLVVIRVLRVLRVFRVLKLVRFMGEAGTLGRALRASRYKITVFLITVVAAVVIVGALMFLIEGPANGFTSIPFAMYWAIVTLTTVGYGDVSPATPLGQFLAALVMILGYAIIAVPTGIVTTELAQAKRMESSLKCAQCQRSGHDEGAAFCKHCGGPLAGERTE